jgi:hypothetical protein
MRRRNRAIVGLVSTVAVVCIAWFLLRRSLKPERILTDPGTILSVECMHKPGNATDDYEWLLTLDATGSGTFTKWPSLFSRTSVPISVPKQIPQLQKAVNDCRLSQLPLQIGGAVPDSSTDRLRIKTTHLDKRITIGFVQPGDDNDDVRCAHRLWTAIQQCAPKL